MRKMILAAASMLTLASGSAFAADLRMPVKAPAAYVADTFNWSGFYLGVQGGGGFGRSSFDFPAASVPHNTSGGLLGGTIGYNWQSSNWVFGVEGDGAWARINGSSACPNPAFACRTTINSFSTLRGRLGYAWGPTMIYATGGAVGAHINARTVNLAGVAQAPSGTAVNGQERYRVGWTAGAGIEYMFAQNWSLKAEALYFDLGRANYAVDNGIVINSRQTGVVGRGGINYHFNWGGPVVARY
jgi:outer membrane immunogenic protein